MFDWTGVLCIEHSRHREGMNGLQDVMKAVEWPVVFDTCFGAPGSFVRPWDVERIRKVVKMEQARTTTHLFHIRLVKSDVTGDGCGSLRVNMATEILREVDGLSQWIGNNAKSEASNTCLAFYMASQEDGISDFMQICESCRSCRKGFDKLFTAIKQAADRNVEFRISPHLTDPDSPFYVEELSRKILCILDTKDQTVFM